MYKGLLLFLTMNFLGAGCYLTWDVLANRLTTGPAAVLGGAASGGLGLVSLYFLVKMWIRELTCKKRIVNELSLPKTPYGLRQLNMAEFAAVVPGEYFVFDQRTGKIVASQLGQVECT